AREKNIEVHFATAVLALEQDAGGAVVGVKTRDGTLTAQKIILASGGFGASTELLSKYIPKAVGIPFPGHHGSTGDGIQMGLGIGAAVEVRSSPTRRTSARESARSRLRWRSRAGSWSMPQGSVLSMRPDIPEASASKCSTYPANRRTRFSMNGFFSCTETPLD